MFNVFYADCIGREGNCLYLHRTEVTDAASRAQTVGHDYVCADYKNSYRSKANFMPVTEGQVEYTGIAEVIYSEFGSGGKYILDGRRLFICQSNAPAE